MGIAAPGVMPTIANLDVTFSNCRYSGFNRRLSGTLSLYPTQKYAQLGLYGASITPFSAAAAFDIRATLRR
jgi:hypothetical protein